MLVRCDGVLSAGSFTYSRRAQKESTAEANYFVSIPRAASREWAYDASPKEPVRKGPLGLYVLMMTPEDVAFVLMSARCPLPSAALTAGSCTKRKDGASATRRELSFNFLLTKLFLYAECFANIAPPLAIENGDGQRLLVGNR